MSTQPVPSPDIAFHAVRALSVASAPPTPEPPVSSAPMPEPYPDVPQQLKEIPNWVCWKLEMREGKPTKIPYNPATGRNAKANDPTTWGTFEQAVEAADPRHGNKYQGIGFEFGGTHYGGIDFDSSVAADGTVDSYVLAILKLLGDPYTEFSPSGTGLHAPFECSALPVGKRKFTQGHDGIEIYHGTEPGRFFTVSGNRFSGKNIPKIADISLPYLLISQCQDKKFKALWLGDTSAHGGDDSTADFHLMLALARLTKNDPVKMRTYFSASALAQREKWTDRPDYAERTINNAIAANPVKGTEPVALEFQTQALPDPDGDYVLAPLDGQDDGLFPLGDISLVGGASGVGKTTWIFEMLHKQKQGNEVLGHRTFHRTFQVLAYDRGRNAFTRTMRRLKLLPTDIPTTPLPLAFGTKAVQNIINQIEKMNPIPQIVFIEGLDMLIDDANKKSVVSPFMRQLQEVAEHFHIALICSVGAPKSKRGEEYAAKRDHISGSEAWGRNCETVVVLEFSSEDDGTAPQRELTILPRNAKAEKFSLQFEGGRLVRIEPTAGEEQKPILGRPNKALQTAIQFLEQQLQGGPRDSKELVQHAFDQEDIKRTTLFAAAKELKLAKTDKGRVWALSQMHEGYLPDMGDMETITL